VVGASLAGLHAVEAARESGFTGSVTLIGAEPCLPYNRPPLSKQFLDAHASPETPLHRTEDSLRALDVDLRLGQPASELDIAARQVAVGGERIGYDALVIATGVRARTLPTALGADGLAGVHTLRTIADARAVRSALDAGARTVVIGAGFIGCEVAAAARKRGLPVTLVEALPTPLRRAVGESMGAAVSRLHRLHGAELRCGVTVTEIKGAGRVERVVLSDRSVLAADLVVVGIGTAPETEWLRSSSLDVTDGVRCDETLMAAPGVYAAGDVARWRSPLFDRTMRVEHWTVAAEQGALAARNALDPAAAQPYASVPYFWSDCYDSKIQFAGIAGTAEPEIVAGGVYQRKFTAVYREGDRVIGAFTMNNPGHSAKYQALIARESQTFYVD
jgi:NADPH-dependent 2,4-dienoyl-CoA reductase/sulfur reductase-like enzyme